METESQNPRPMHYQMYSFPVSLPRFPFLFPVSLLAIIKFSLR